MNIPNKKLLVSLVVPVLVFSILSAGCSKTHTGSSQITPFDKSKPLKDDPDSEVKMTPLNANTVVDAFKKAGIPISNEIAYTEENDVNHLLGRPNQYIEKINWADTRAEQTVDIQSPVGGSVEIFSNTQDLDKRYDYIKQVGDNPMLIQYMYKADVALVRIDKELTPKQAKQYEAVLKGLVE